MNHPIQCSCGALKGTIDEPELANRGVCYCRDCRAFAHFLKRSADILDDWGGSDVIQTVPKYVRFTEGSENLACMRLTEKGLLRWYARCCNTPIGNTPASFKTPFVGLVHTCLKTEGGSLDDAFGPIRARIYTQYAKGEGAPKSVGTARFILRALAMMLRARIDGSYKKTPFFSTQTGAPIVTPKVLSAQELKQVMSEV